MEELRIYLDPERRNEVGESIEFEPVYAGKKEQRSIFIENIIKYPVNVALMSDNPKINILKNNFMIPPGSMQKVDMEFIFDMEEIEPIKVAIKIKITYTAR